MGSIPIGASEILNMEGELDRRARRGCYPLRTLVVWESCSPPSAKDAMNLLGVIMADSELLTPDERAAISMAGQLYVLIAERIVGHGPSREADLAEMTAAIHIIQDKIKGQAAGRAYPAECRLLGEIIPCESDNSGIYISGE